MCERCHPLTMGRIYCPADCWVSWGYLNNIWYQDNPDYTLPKCSPWRRNPMTLSSTIMHQTRWLGERFLSYFNTNCGLKLLQIARNLTQTVKWKWLETRSLSGGSERFWNPKHFLHRNIRRLEITTYFCGIKTILKAAGSCCSVSGCSRVDMKNDDDH